MVPNTYVSNQGHLLDFMPHLYNMWIKSGKKALDIEVYCGFRFLDLKDNFSIHSFLRTSSLKYPQQIKNISSLKLPISAYYYIFLYIRVQKEGQF